MKARLEEKYRKEIVPVLKQEFGLKNSFSVPRVEKIVLNIGTGKALKDDKLFEIMISNLKRITGQLPLKTRAKKSIANFGIREGLIIGLKVTLRGQRMYEFLDKLVNVALPRVKDFRGISDKAFDKVGNYTLGFKEHTAFPEIRHDEVEKIHGLEISFTIKNGNPEKSKRLFELLGFPFQKE